MSGCHEDEKEARPPMRRLQRGGLEALLCGCWPSALQPSQDSGKETTEQLLGDICPAARQDEGHLRKSGIGPENGPRLRGPLPVIPPRPKKNILGRMVGKNYHLRGLNSDEKFECLT